MTSKPLSKTIVYRKLARYKYQVMRPCEFATGIAVGERVCSKEQWIVLEKDGLLRIRKGYAWDGPSGPTIDTKNFMRGSLVHDALYQLIREGLLDMKFRKPADQLLRAMCLEDGMWRIRAWWVYWGVRILGKFAAKPRPVPQNLEAP